MHGVLDTKLKRVKHKLMQHVEHLSNLGSMYNLLEIGVSCLNALLITASEIQATFVSLSTKFLVLLLVSIIHHSIIVVQLSFVKQNSFLRLYLLAPLFDHFWGVRFQKCVLKRC